MEWPLLADLEPEDVRQLLAIARRRVFGKGDIVFHRDDPADSLHLIVRGRFAARVATPQGDSVLLEVLGPGQSFGELALLLPGASRSATVSALEDGETRSVYRDGWKVTTDHLPGFASSTIRSTQAASPRFMHSGCSMRATSSNFAAAPSMSPSASAQSIRRAPAAKKAAARPNMSSPGNSSS